MNVTLSYIELSSRLPVTIFFSIINCFTHESSIIRCSSLFALQFATTYRNLNALLLCNNRPAINVMKFRSHYCTRNNKVECYWWMADWSLYLNLMCTPSLKAIFGWKRCALYLCKYGIYISIYTPMTQSLSNCNWSYLFSSQICSQTIIKVYSYEAKDFSIRKRVAEGQMILFARGENSASRGLKNKYIKLNYEGRRINLSERHW